LKKIASLVLCSILIISTLFIPKQSNAETGDSCSGVKYGQKVYWENSELKPGQIGKVQIVKDTILYKLSGSKLIKYKTLKQGSSFRIYNFKSNLLGVGGGYYIVRDAKITYKTPSKQKLQIAVCASTKPASSKTGNTNVAMDVCKGILPGQQIKWENSILKPGQIGKLYTVKDTILYKLSGSTLTKAKTLKKGNTYRIYNFKTNLLGVGGGYYIKRDNRIT
jgi:uncharacterized membrane protein